MLKYTMMHPLSRGGISELDMVMLEDGRNAVLRRLLPFHALNIGNYMMFRRGIRVRAGLPANEYIVSSYSTGYAGLLPAEIIEYVLGNNLKALFNQNSAVLRENMYHVLLSAARGLAFVHSNGLQHLDVKPENFLLRQGSGISVKLTDFDLARQADDFGPRKQSGTPAYMAPEQLSSKCSSQASDVFAFCVMAYHFIGRRAPFAGSTVKSTIKHQASMRVQAKPLFELNPTVPENWNDAIMCGLAKRPEERIQDMNEWLQYISD